MKQLTTDAIIIKRVNYQEADRIITLLTEEHGKVTVLAKGVRKSKSRLAGGLELFSVSTITFIDGKSNIKTLVSSKLKSHYESIVKDINLTMVSYDFLKAADKYSEENISSKTYEIAVSALSALSAGIDPAVVSVWFYVQLMQDHGNNVNLEKPSNAEKYEEDSLYNFSIDDMNFFEHESGRYDAKSIKFLRYTSVSRSPEDLSRVEGVEELALQFGDLFKNLALSI